MGHYRSNLRDLEFNLFEVLGVGERLGAGPFAEVDAETARGILAEVERLAVRPGRRVAARLRPQPAGLRPGRPTPRPLPESFKKSFRAYMDAEWWRLDLPEELGGTVVPALAAVGRRAR